MIWRRKKSFVYMLSLRFFSTQKVPTLMKPKKELPMLLTKMRDSSWL